MKLCGTAKSQFLCRSPSTISGVWETMTSDARSNRRNPKALSCSPNLWTTSRTLTSPPACPQAHVVSISRTPKSRSTAVVWSGRPLTKRCYSPSSGHTSTRPTPVCNGSSVRHPSTARKQKREKRTKHQTKLRLVTPSSVDNPFFGFHATGGGLFLGFCGLLDHFYDRPIRKRMSSRLRLRVRGVAAPRGSRSGLREVNSTLLALGLGRTPEELPLPSSVFHHPSRHCCSSRAS